MGSIRNQFESFIDKAIRPKSPELEAPLVAAIDAYEMILDTGAATPDRLAPIVAAVESSRRPLYEATANFLQQLSPRHASAVVAIEKLFKDQRAHVRFNAILCLGKETPDDFKLSMLRAGLRDKSARVRQKAADWAGRLRLKELVPDLHAAAQDETNAVARHTMEFVLGLLRDGYVIEPDKMDGTFSVTTFSRSGIRGCSVSQADLERRGIEAIVAELAAPRTWER